MSELPETWITWQKLCGGIFFFQMIFNILEQVLLSLVGQCSLQYFFVFKQTPKSLHHTVVHKLEAHWLKQKGPAKTKCAQICVKKHVHKVLFTCCRGYLPDLEPAHFAYGCSLFLTLSSLYSHVCWCCSVEHLDREYWLLHASCWRKEGIARLSTCWRLMRMASASAWAAALLPCWSSSSCRNPRCSRTSSSSEDVKHRLSTALPWETHGKRC